MVTDSAHGAAPAEERGGLPRQLTGLASPIIWGVLLLIAIEGTLLALFAVSYLYLQMGTESWPPPGVTPSGLLWPVVGQLMLLLSVLPVWLAVGEVSRGRMRALVYGLPVGILLALGYLGLKLREYAVRSYSWDAHAYGSIDWTMSGYAALHVVVVILAALVVWGLALRGHFGPHRYTGVQAVALYWLFAAVGSAFFFAIQTLSPRL